MRYVAICMAVVFSAFAAVQYNDPDAWVWVSLYGLAVVASVLAACGRYTLLPLAGLVAYASGFVILAPAIDANWYDIEEAREALGLAIAALAMAVLLVARSRSRHAE